MSTQTTRPNRLAARAGHSNLNELRQALDRLATRSDAQFAAELEQRKLEEREWADFSRDTEGQESPQHSNEKTRGNRKWYSTTQLSNDYRDRWLASKVKGKVFVDFACGDGEIAVHVAKNMDPALSIGLDISRVSVENGARAAREQGVAEKCVCVQTDCENTGLPDESVDVILCHYMLHHLDLNHAYPELHRILKKGGCILACEALNYNPIIQFYRKCTPQMRTEWEKDHILSLKEVRLAKRFSFNVGQIRYWHLFSILGAFVNRVPPLFKLVMPLLNLADRLVLKIPGLQLMAWQFSFELFKPKR